MRDFPKPCRCENGEMRTLLATALLLSTVSSISACRSTAETTPAVTDTGAGAEVAASPPPALAPTTPPASAAIAPHDKTLDITLRGAKHPEKIHLTAGDTTLTLDKAGHWQGAVHGSGKIVVQAAPGTSEEIKPAKVDLKADEPVARVLLFVDQPFQQACAR